jgi:hypothetical protein
MKTIAAAFIVVVLVAGCASGPAWTARHPVATTALLAFGAASLYLTVRANDDHEEIPAPTGPRTGPEDCLYPLQWKFAPDGSLICTF